MDKANANTVMVDSMKDNGYKERNQEWARSSTLMELDLKALSKMTNTMALEFKFIPTE